VAPAPHSELYLSQCGVLGRQPALLEVVEFEHHGHDGDPTQPENVLIAGSPWVLGPPVRAADALALLRSVRHADPLIFGNRGKAVHVDDTAGGVSESLIIVEPTELRFEHRSDAKARALFEHGGREWDLGLTDFVVYGRVLAAPVGVHTAASLGLPPTVLLTLSLGLPLGEFHHKLVAAVLAFA